MKIPIETRSDIDKHTIYFVNKYGEVVGKIVNIKEEKENDNQPKRTREHNGD